MARHDSTQFLIDCNTFAFLQRRHEVHECLVDCLSAVNISMPDFLINDEEHRNTI